MSKELVVVFMVLALLLAIVPLVAISYVAYLRVRYYQGRKHYDLPTSTKTTITRSANGRTVFQTSNTSTRQAAVVDNAASKPLPLVPSLPAIPPKTTSRAWSRLSRPFSQMPSRKASVHELRELSQHVQPHAITRYSEPDHEQDMRESFSRPVSHAESWERVRFSSDEQPVSPQVGNSRQTWNKNSRSPIFGSVPSYRVANTDFTTVPLTPPTITTKHTHISQRALKQGELGYMPGTRQWV